MIITNKVFHVHVNIAEQYDLIILCKRANNVIFVRKSGAGRYQQRAGRTEEDHRGDPGSVKKEAENSCAKQGKMAQ